MNSIQFSVSPTTHYDYRDGGIDSICTPGYAAYWLVEKGFVVTPTEEESKDFWKYYLTIAAEIQPDSNSEVREDLLTELREAGDCLGTWVEHFLCKYFYAKTALEIRQEIASEGEVERYTVYSKHSQSYDIWRREFSLLSDEELEDELQNVAEDHLAISKMRQELHGLLLSIQKQ